MTDLPALIARLEAAEVGSRELGREVVAATNPYKSGAYSHWATAAAAFDWSIDVTTSLDAALALAERVLPGWAWMVRYWPEDQGAGVAGWTAYVRETDRNLVGSGPVFSSACIALVIAILRAKQGEGE